MPAIPEQETSIASTRNSGIRASSCGPWTPNPSRLDVAGDVVADRNRQARSGRYATVFVDAIPTGRSISSRVFSARRGASGSSTSRGRSCRNMIAAVGSEQTTS